MKIQKKNVVQRVIISILLNRDYNRITRDLNINIVNNYL